MAERLRETADPAVFVAEDGASVLLLEDGTYWRWNRDEGHAVQVEREAD